MPINGCKLWKTQCYIGGRWIPAIDGETLAVRNPATGEVLGTVPKCGSKETSAAIDAAVTAMNAWKALTALERSKHLHALHALIEANLDELAAILTL